MRSRSPLAALAAPLLTLALAACSRPSAAPADGSKRYPLAGRVESVDTAAGRATIAHEDIPGFMPGMTMEFAIPDAAALAALKPGDVIRAELVYSADNRVWLEGLTVTAHGPAPSPPATPAAPPGQVGDLAPDVKLVDQDDRPLSLSAYRGEALAVTFVFTRCPLPEYCPLMMTRFAEAARLLAADAGLRARARLLTVSFDTAFDRPAVLRDYGARFQPEGPAPFELWRFATGEPAQVRRLAEFAGLDYVEERGSFTHTLRTAVLGPDGRLRSLRRGNDWPAAELVGDLRAALR